MIDMKRGSWKSSHTLMVCMLFLGQLVYAEETVMKTSVQLDANGAMFNTIGNAQSIEINSAGFKSVPDCDMYHPRPVTFDAHKCADFLAANRQMPYFKVYTTEEVDGIKREILTTINEMPPTVAKSMRDMVKDQLKREIINELQTSTLGGTATRSSAIPWGVLLTIFAFAMLATGGVGLAAGYFWGHKSGGTAPAA
jgi:hypothetical protein